MDSTTGVAFNAEDDYPSGAPDPTLSCKEVRGFQAFVPLDFVLSFGLFQICLVTLDLALLMSHMCILHLTRINL